MNKKRNEADLQSVVQLEEITWSLWWTSDGNVCIVSRHTEVNWRLTLGILHVISIYVSIVFMIFITSWFTRLQANKTNDVKRVKTCFLLQNFNTYQKRKCGLETFQMIRGWVCVVVLNSVKTWRHQRAKEELFLKHSLKVLLKNPYKRIILLIFTPLYWC